MNKHVINFVIVACIVLIFIAVFFDRFYSVFFPDIDKTENYMNLDNIITPENFEDMPPENNYEVDEINEYFQNRPTLVNDPAIDYTPSINDKPNTYFTDTMDENLVNKYINVLRDGVTEIGKGTYVSVDKSFMPLKVNNINNVSFSFWIQINTTFQKHDLTVIELYSHSKNTKLGDYPYLIRFNTVPDHTGLLVLLNNGRLRYNIPPRYIVRGRWVNVTIVLSDLVKIYVGGEKLIDQYFGGLDWFYPLTLITLPHYSKDAGDVKFSRIKLIPLAVKENFIKNILMRDYPVLDGNPGAECVRQNANKSESTIRMNCGKFFIDTIPNKYDGIPLKLNSNFVAPTNLKNFRLPSYKILDGKLVVYSGMARKTKSGSYSGYLTSELKALPTKHLSFGLRDQFDNRVSVYLDFKGIIINGLNKDPIGLNNLFYGISSYYPLEINTTNWRINSNPGYNIASDIVYLTGLLTSKVRFNTNKSRIVPVKIADIPPSIRPPAGTVLRWEMPNAVIQYIDGTLEYLGHNTAQIQLNQINWCLSKGSDISLNSKVSYLKEYSKWVPLPPSKVKLYADSFYRGKSFEFGPGKYNINQIKIGNDTLSSLNVPEGMNITLFKDSNFRGDAKIFGPGGIPQLSEYFMRKRPFRRLVNWNDEMSSFTVSKTKDGDQEKVTFGDGMKPQAYKFGDFVKLSGSVIVNDSKITSLEIGKLEEKFCPNMYLTFMFEGYKITIWRNGGILLELNPNKRPLNNAYSLDKIIYWMGVEQN